MNLDSEIIMYTVEDIADLLMINRETVRKWIKNDKLKAIKQGSNKDGYLIMSCFLEKFLSDNPGKYVKIYKLNHKMYGNKTTIKEFILEYVYTYISAKDYIDLCRSALVYRKNFEEKLREIIHDDKKSIELCLSDRSYVIKQILSQINIIL